MQRCTGSALSPPAPVGPWLPGCDADDAAAAAPNCCRHHRHDDPRTAMLQMPALKLGLPQPPQPFFNKSCAALLFPAPSLQPHVMTAPWPRMVAKAQSEAWIHSTVLRYGPATAVHSDGRGHILCHLDLDTRVANRLIGIGGGSHSDSVSQHVGRSLIGLYSGLRGLGINTACQ